MMNGITKPNVWKHFLPSDHKATNVADALKDIQQTWKLPEEGQVSITTDNGANKRCKHFGIAKMIVLWS